MCGLLAVFSCIYLLAFVQIGIASICPEHDGPATCTCPPIGWEDSKVLPACKPSSEWISQPTTLNGSVSFENPCLDFRDQDIVTSFKSAVGALEKYYAFTAYKRLDWEEIEEHILPLVEEAAAHSSASMYMEAILKLITYIPDGHVSLSPFCNQEEYANLTSAHVGGSFGFAVAVTDDGKYIVTYVIPDSAAGNAGLKAGDELLETGTNPTIPMTTWVLMQTFEAYAYTLTKPFAEPTGRWTNPARRKSKRRALLRALLRAPVGSSQVFFFKDAGRKDLWAYEDNYFDLKAMKHRSSMAHALDDPIKYKILPSGIGYLAIADVNTLNGTPEGGWLDKIAEAMDYVKDTKGLIIDLRSNAGGADSWASVFPAFFANSRERLYEKIAYPNAYLRSNEDLIEALNVTYSPSGYSTLPSDLAQASNSELYTMAPRRDAYEGEVACIINGATIGSGEGLAWACKDMIAKYVVGFDGTSGSFGMAGSRIVLPGGNPPSADAVEKGFMISFPAFYSADENGTAQLDSNPTTGEGGVHPTKDGLIPSTAENLVAYARGIMGNDPEDDIEVETAEKLLLKARAPESQVDACTYHSKVVFNLLCVSYTGLWLLAQSY